MNVARHKGNNSRRYRIIKSEIQIRSSHPKPLELFLYIGDSQKCKLILKWLREIHRDGKPISENYISGIAHIEERSDISADVKALAEELLEELKGQC